MRCEMLNQAYAVNGMEGRCWEPELILPDSDVVIFFVLDWNGVVALPPLFL